MKRDYSLDNEEIRKYFPADLVVQGMFDVYSKLLGVNFVKSRTPRFGLRESSSTKFATGKPEKCWLIFIPTSFRARSSMAMRPRFRSSAEGSRASHYQKPVAAIVANLSAPTGDQPSLLLHDDVETMFHEFGHVMHGTLTRAPYESQSGTNVAMDFVEAPSQMLENWVWDESILKQVSGNYQDHSKKLPDELLKKDDRGPGFQQRLFLYSPTRVRVFGYELPYGARPGGSFGRV